MYFVYSCTVLRANVQNRKTSVFAYGPASRMYFSARAEGRISYGHLGRTNSCLIIFNVKVYLIGCLRVQLTLACRRSSTPKYKLRRSAAHRDTAVSRPTPAYMGYRAYQHAQHSLYRARYCFTNYVCPYNAGICCLYTIEHILKTFSTVW